MFNNFLCGNEIFLYVFLLIISLGVFHLPCLFIFIELSKVHNNQSKQIAKIARKIDLKMEIDKDKESLPAKEKANNDGVSEQLNFTSERNLVMVEYPGKVVNVDKMLSTLGGLKNVSGVITGEQKQLELHYHPENPFNKPAIATCQTNAGLLLSVKIRRSKRQPSRIMKQEVSILGRCCKRYTFDSKFRAI